MEKMEAWKELQQSNRQEIYALEGRRGEDQKRFYEALERQYGKSMEQVTKLDIKMKEFTQGLWDHRRDVRQQLEALGGFKESILENQAKIDSNTHTIEATQKQLSEFRNDDMFLNCQSNYTKVYQELSR
jgi:hypothetical protein